MAEQPRSGGTMQRGAALTSEPLPPLDHPWDQGPRVDGFDPRSPMLIRALEANRDAAARVLSEAAASVPSSDTRTLQEAASGPAAEAPGQALSVPDGTGVAQPPAGACTHWGHGGYCGATDDLRRFLPGLRCPEHTPARLAGRPEVLPDPARSIEALRASARQRHSEPRRDLPVRQRR